LEEGRRVGEGQTPINSILTSPPGHFVTNSRVGSNDQMRVDPGITDDQDSRDAEHHHREKKSHGTENSKENDEEKSDGHGRSDSIDISISVTGRNVPE